MRSGGIAELWREGLRRLGPTRVAASAGVLAVLLAYREVIAYQPRRAVRDPIEAWFFEVNETAPQLIYLVFLWMLWHRRHAIRSALRAQGSLAAGGLFLACAAGLYLWSRRVGQIDLLLDSFLLLSIGSALLIAGRRLLLTVALPLVLLWLVRPLPPVLSHQLHYALQLGTAEFASWMLRAGGLVVLQSGELIQYAGRTFQVIETCSGLRILQALMMGALLLAEFFCHRREERIAVILAAPAVGFLVNGIRVATLVLSPWGDVAPVHSFQGLVMVFAGMLLLALVGRMVGWAFRWRRVSRAVAPSSPAPSPEDSPPPHRGRLLALGVAIAALALLSFVPLRAKPPQGAVWRIQRVSRSLDNWEAKPLEWDQRYYGSVKFADKLLMEHRRGSNRIEFFLGLSDRRRRYQVGLSPKTRLPGTGWGVREAEWIELDRVPVPVERLIVAKGLRQALVYHWRLGAHSVGLEALRWLVAADLDPRVPASSLVSVRVSADIGLGGRARAESVLDSFLEDFVPALLAGAPER